MGASPSLSSSLFLILLYHSSLLTLEKFRHTKLKVNLIRGLVHNQKLTCSVRTQYDRYFKHQLLPLMLCEALPPKKECHPTLVKERMQNKRHNLSKTEQSAKTNFFEALTMLRSKNFELTKDAYIYKDCARFFLDLIHILVILEN